MLRKIFKWILGIVGVLILLIIIFYAVIYFRTQSRINKVYPVTLQTLKLPSDSASYVKGQHVAEIRGCKGCHGHDLGGGRAFADEKSPIGLLYAANITSGKGGIDFKDEDWIRVLRHGLGKDGKSLWFMPSHEIYHISNEDMAALLYYLKQQPAVDRSIPAKSLKPLGRILTFFDQFPLLPAEMIDHNATYKETVPAEVTAEYGHYLAITCHGCHGENMKGAPAHDPKEPPIPDVSSTGHPGKWTDADFMKALRTGRTPEGRLLTDYMPWKEITYTDDEMKAVFLYLQSIK
ncbi:MAG: cytochrome c [Bacteroidota bacterium]